jgi:Ni,Fe-hydrogenase III large subunit
VEQLLTITVPTRARYLRVVFAELERLANHFGDIGAIMLDTGFNFGGSHGGRLREKIMQLCDRLTGSRFLRGVNTVGGVTKDIGEPDIDKVTSELGDISKDFLEIIDAAENSASLLNRLKNTGTLESDIAKDHGVTGVAAKACGIALDSRIDFPYAAYSDLGMNWAETEQTGDVYARFCVRVREADASITLVRKALKSLLQGPIVAPVTSPLPKNALTISMVEGWRGSIVYFIATDSSGNISRVAPRDPSFVNWPALEYAGLGNIVPDFPLINKSFNLSYTGNDL